MRPIKTIIQNTQPHPPPSGAWVVVDDELGEVPEDGAGVRGGCEGVD